MLLVSPDMRMKFQWQTSITMGDLFVLQLYILVGGLEHVLYIYILGIIYNPNWRSHIFQRGRYTTNQNYMFLYVNHQPVYVYL